MDCSELHSLQTPAECSAALGSLQSPWLAVHPERCVRLRHRLVECGRCADACTGGAIGLEDGVLDVDPRRCVGCGACQKSCPFGVISIHPETGKAMKCDGCWGRIQAGLLPACVHTCPTGALTLTD